MSAEPGSAVGIIGVGAAGMAIAERLIADGKVVHGYRRGSLDQFSAIGGIPSGSASEVVARAGPLILLVPDEAGLMAVMAEVIPSLRPGQVLLCLASHPAPVKQAAADMAARAGAVLLDGELSGTPIMVREGRSTVMIAGDLDAIERVAPVLAAFARHTARLDAFGDAYRMKLVANYLVGVHTLAAAEAVETAKRLGLDPMLAVNTLVPSAGGSKMLEVRGPMMAAGSYAPGSIRGFSAYFDMLRTMLAARGEEAGPLLEFTESAYRRAIDDGYGDCDIAAVHESLAGRAAPTTPIG